MIRSIPDLSTALPELWLQVSALARDLQAKVYNAWPPLIERLGFLGEPDFIVDMEICIPGWRKISTVQDGVTAKHTLLVLALSLTLPEYQQALPQTKREIEWTALIHDIDKDVSGGRKDLTHPVRSAAVAIKALQILGFEVQHDISSQDLDE